MRTITLYIHTGYLAEQVRWLSVQHPLVHHLDRALHGDPGLHTLQLSPTAIREFTPELIRLTQPTLTRGTDFGMLSIAADVFNAVGKLSGDPSGSFATATRLPRQEIARAIALLRSDLRRPWRIEELAREVAVSPSHLARVFRTEIGTSPAAFLRQLRTDRMAELLATTTLTVSEAGASVGWRDAAMASRSFKHRYGVTPSTYAKSHRTTTPALSTSPLSP